MQVYLDNSATTRPYDAVRQAVFETMGDCYANPASLHSAGKAAEDLVEAARRSVARLMGADAKEVVFTSGGTESDNLAILGYCAANARNGKRVITQKTEHPAVLQCFLALEKQGFDVQYLDVSRDGIVDLEQFASLLNKDTILTSCMQVNNETGAVMPISDMARILRQTCPSCALHVDGVQGFGKCLEPVKTLGADLYSVSAHKLHGPHGVGALYVKKGIRLSPHMYGGGQEGGLRSGTGNTAGICGFQTACELQFAALKENFGHAAMLKNALLDGLRDLPDVLNNSSADALPYIVNLSFLGVKSEVLLHVLESYGIYVSSGSACSSHKRTGSHVLNAMGLSKNEVDSALRFSFSHFNTLEEVLYVTDVLRREVPALRKIMRIK